MYWQECMKSKLWWAAQCLPDEMSSQQQWAVPTAGQCASTHTHTHTCACINPLTSHYLWQNKSQKSLSGVLITLSVEVHLWEWCGVAFFFSLCEISISAVLADRDWDWRELMEALQLTLKKTPHNITGIMAQGYVQAVITDYAYQKHSFCFQPSAANSAATSLLCVFVHDASIPLFTTLWDINPHSVTIILDTKAISSSIMVLFLC